MPNRKTNHSKNTMAGCFKCNGTYTLWKGKNARAIAVRHHDTHGHTTWVDSQKFTTYGENEDREMAQIREG